MSARTISGLRHELLDRAFIIGEMFDLSLAEPVIGEHEKDEGTHGAAVPPSIQIQIESISRQLHALYQAIGALEGEA